MKTIKMTRTIRREINGMFITIGPEGLTFRQKRLPKEDTLRLTWEQALANAVVEEQNRPTPLVEIKPVPDDPAQVPMFPELSQPLTNAHLTGFKRLLPEYDIPACGPEVGVHMTHCNMGGYVGVCKYGEHDTCPALETPKIDVDEVLSTEGDV